MKKNIIKIASLCFMTLALLTSCEEDTVTYNGGDFVTFSNVGVASIGASEADGTIEIPVNLTMPQPNDVTVNFTITDLAPGTPSVGYTVAGSSITIPAGQTTGKIVINIIDDEDNTPAARLKVQLTSTSSPVIGIGIADEGSYMKTLVIANDDCPTRYNLWFGTVSVMDVGYPPAVNMNGAPSESGDCDVLQITGDLAGFNRSPKILFYFTPDAEGSTTGTIDVPQQTYCTACSSGMNTTYKATGYYDESIGYIYVDYQFRRSDGAGYDGANEIIAPGF